MSANLALAAAAALVAMAARRRPAGSMAARASRGEPYMSATLTPGHGDDPEVRRAAQIASRAKQEGAPLGEGFFGVAYLVDGHVVKLPRYEVAHRPRKTPEEARAYLLHEAGVANELREAGHTVVPKILFTELEDGTPALVREYGEPVESLSMPELVKLERELYAVERDGAGWDVADELLLLRRADGSVFVGDVGFWRARKKPRDERGGDIWQNESGVPGLLSRWVTQAGMGEDVSKALRLDISNTVERLEEFIEWLDGPFDPEGITGLVVEDLAPDLARYIVLRDQFGLDVPDEARRLMSDIKQKIEQLGMRVDPSIQESSIRRLKRTVAARKKIGAMRGTVGSASRGKILLYHGGHRWEDPPKIVKHRKGNAEHGTGIYLTTSWERANRYSKGGGRVYRMELDPPRLWLHDAKVSVKQAVDFVQRALGPQRRIKILDGIQRASKAIGGTIPAEILVNLFVNNGLSHGEPGAALSRFLVEEVGVDASLNHMSGEDWVIVFNPKILTRVEPVPSKKIGSPGWPFDLPRVDPKAGPA